MVDHSDGGGECVHLLLHGWGVDLCNNALGIVDSRNAQHIQIHAGWTIVLGNVPDAVGRAISPRHHGCKETVVQMVLGVHRARVLEAPDEQHDHDVRVRDFDGARVWNAHRGDGVVRLGGRGQHVVGSPRPGQVHRAGRCERRRLWVHGHLLLRPRRAMEDTQTTHAETSLHYDGPPAVCLLGAQRAKHLIPHASGWSHVRHRLFGDPSSGH